MEKLEVQNVVKELLCEGKELTKQLQAHLLVHDHDHQNLEFLLDRILYSYEQALSILAPPPSPHTQDSHQDQLAPSRNRWSEKIKVGAELAGIEDQLDDGYGWRKYGQKHILGAKYPRGYYKCTYRHAQGCLATKQVQRSNSDPTSFEITYRRNHTCSPRGNSISNPPEPQAEDRINPSLTQDLGTNENPSFNFKFNSSPSTNNPENNHTSSYGTHDHILEKYKPNDHVNEYAAAAGNSVVAAMTSTTNDYPSASSSNFTFANSGFFP